MIGQFNITGKQVKLTQRFITILSVILACVVGGGLWLLPAEIARAATRIPEPKLSYDIPINPNIAFNPETDFGTFAWQAFVALNSPADCHGFPLKGTTIGEVPNAPRVWEFYHFPEDVFMPDGVKPNLDPVVPPQCLGFGDRQKSYPVRILVEGQDPLIPLIDRAGNYILNEVRMNPVEVSKLPTTKLGTAMVGAFKEAQSLPD